jgi:hypothetical protein
VGPLPPRPGITSYAPADGAHRRGRGAAPGLHGAEEIRAQHFAFLVGEGDFELIVGRLRDGGRERWADLFKRQPYEINHKDGGHGLHWMVRMGTGWLEAITRPYGSGG